MDIETVLKLDEDERFVWDTPASRELVRSMMLRVMAHAVRENIQELGPRAVAANRKVREMDERFEKARCTLWSEMTHAIEDQLAAADLKTCDKPAEQ